MRIFNRYKDNSRNAHYDPDLHSKSITLSKPFPKYSAYTSTKVSVCSPSVLSRVSLLPLFAFLSAALRW